MEARVHLHLKFPPKNNRVRPAGTRAGILVANMEVLGVTGAVTSIEASLVGATAERLLQAAPMELEILLRADTETRSSTCRSIRY